MFNADQFIFEVNQKIQKVLKPHFLMWKDITAVLKTVVKGKSVEQLIHYNTGGIRKNLRRKIISRFVWISLSNLSRKEIVGVSTYILVKQ